MKSRLFVSLIVIIFAIAAVIGGTVASLSDRETSSGNTLSAATLDLKMDGNDDNEAKFNVTNIRPGNQLIYTYDLNNAGSIAGFLNLSNIVVTNLENGITDPEVHAGDVTADVGELGSRLGICLFWDDDNDGWVDPGEAVIYQGSANGIASAYTALNKPLAAGGTTYLTLQVNWFDSGSDAPDNPDNLAQGDTYGLSLAVDLTQFAK